MSETADSQASPETVGEAIHYCHQSLADSDACYGHGTDNAWDEAVQLVLSVADLPMDSDEKVMPHRIDEVARRDILRLLQRRVAEHIPLPYLLGRAWFAGLSGAALDAKILEVFQQFDTDNSGYLEFDEFKMACEKMGLSLADEDLKALVREFDQDGDEQISFDEFRHAVKVWISQ